MFIKAQTENKKTSKVRRLLYRFIILLIVINYLYVIFKDNPKLINATIEFSKLPGYEIFVIISNFIIIVGPITLITVYFITLRSRRLKKLAQEFNLTFETPAFSIFGLNIHRFQDPISGKSLEVINTMSGKLSGHTIMVRDVRWLVRSWWFKGAIYYHRTIISKDGVEEKINTESLMGYVAVSSIRNWLSRIVTSKSGMV